MTLRAVFQHGVPLGWEKVHAFEDEQGVVLPEPYRTFVAEICDGSGFGPPSCGLMPLSQLPEGPYRPARDLARPFPLTEPWPWEAERSYEELEPLLDPVYNQGSIVLGTDGCGMYWHLIVTGAHRGHVWNICDVGAQPFGAEFGYTAGQAGFAGWVGHWAEGKWWWDAPLTGQRARQPCWPGSGPRPGVLALRPGAPGVCLRVSVEGEDARVGNLGQSLAQARPGGAVSGENGGQVITTLYRITRA